jgi:hypothetical protein
MKTALNLLLAGFTMISMTARLAAASDRAAEFNSQLKKYVDETSAAESARQAFVRQIAEFRKKAGSDDRLKNAAEARSLLQAIKSYPGIPTPARKARDLILHADVPKDRPSFDVFLQAKGANNSEVLETYKMLVATGDALKLGDGFKRETLTAYSQLIRHESEGPNALIEPYIQLRILKLFSEKGWLPPSAAPKVLQLDADLEKERKKLNAQNHQIFGSKDPMKATPEQKLAFMASIQGEMKTATELMKRVAAVVPNP